jgi:hypothetical protein
MWEGVAEIAKQSVHEPGDRPLATMQQVTAGNAECSLFLSHLSLDKY